MCEYLIIMSTNIRSEVPRNDENAFIFKVNGGFGQLLQKQFRRLADSFFRFRCLRFYFPRFFPFISIFERLLFRSFEHFLTEIKKVRRIARRASLLFALKLYICRYGIVVGRDLANGICIKHFGIAYENIIDTHLGRMRREGKHILTE